jgi:predicted transcriptional regulator
MALYQLKNPETREFMLDKEGNAHEVHDGVLTGIVIQKADFEAQYVPFVKG